MQNLLNGKLSAVLLRFALPVLVGNLLQTAYGVADMAVIGRFVGSEALAGVSSAVMLGYIIQSVCTGVTMGGAVLVAQYKGAANERGQTQAIGTLFTVSAIASALVTAVALLLCRPVLEWMSVPGESLAYAYDYARTICWGSVFIFGYNAVCSTLRGLGDSKSPLLFVAVAAACNVVLDLLFTGALNMGTYGAALATVVSQGVSFAIAVLYLKSKSFIFDFKAKSFRIVGEKAVAILKIGLPTAVQMAGLNLSYLLVTSMINAYGVEAAAGAGLGLKINTFAVIPCWALGQAVTTMAGQCVGAGDFARAKAAARAGILLSIAAQLCVIIFIQIFARQIIAFFDADAGVIRRGVLYVRICCSVNFIAYVIMYIANAFATGTGNSLFAMANSLIQSFALRVGLGYLLASLLGYGVEGVYWAEFIAPIPCAFLGIAYMAGGHWKNKRLV